MSIAKDAMLTAHRMGYRVLHDGRVWSPRGRVLKLRKDTEGYWTFNVSLHAYEGRARYTRYIRVGALAAYQKFGAPALRPGIEVRHLAGGQTNDSLWNIEIGTRSDNEMDRPANERAARARHAVRCRLGRAQPKGRSRVAKRMNP